MLKIESNYVTCPAFNNLVDIWLLMPGRDVMTEVWNHRQTCERCRENKQAIEEYRKANEQ